MVAGNAATEGTAFDHAHPPTLAIKRISTDADLRLLLPLVFLSEMAVI